MDRRIREGAAALCLALLAAAPARGWHGKGHHVATELAVRAAAGKLPDFFAKGAATVAHGSLDPDLFTRPIAPAALHSAEAPEHYFDVELLEGNQPPPTRQEFLALCARKPLAPDKVGLLPYAVTEWTQRLTVALAEHRANPDNAHVQAKCLLYAGLLSHYAQDLCQPLHTTIHWDGRARKDGSSPRTRIHAKVDALLGKLEPDRQALLRQIKPAPVLLLMPAVLAEIRRSNELVDTVYRLETSLPELEAPLKPGSPAARFAAERLAAAAAFTASLYLTAWRDSAKIELPWWYARPFPTDKKPPARPAKAASSTAPRPTAVK